MGRRGVKQRVIWEPHPGPQHEFLKAQEFEVMIGGGKGSGKALRYQSLIATPSGFKRLDEIKVGSLILNPSGRAQSVIGFYEQGNIDIFKFTFNDGATVYASGDHLWVAKVVSRSYKNMDTFFWSRNENVYKIYTTQMLIDLISKRDSSSAKIVPHIHIPLCNPLRFNRGRFARRLHPYLIGVAIGDGFLSGLTADTLRFSKTNPHMADRLSEFGYHVEYGGDNTWVVYEEGIASEFDAIGLKGCRSWEKFIPDAYLYAPDRKSVV